MRALRSRSLVWRCIAETASTALMRNGWRTANAGMLMRQSCWIAARLLTVLQVAIVQWCIRERSTGLRFFRSVVGIPNWLKEGGISWLSDIAKEGDDSRITGDRDDNA